MDFVASLPLDIFNTRMLLLKDIELAPATKIKVISLGDKDDKESYNIA